MVSSFQGNYSPTDFLRKYDSDNVLKQMEMERMNVLSSFFPKKIVDHWIAWIIRRPVYLRSRLSAPDLFSAADLIFQQSFLSLRGGLKQEVKDTYTEGDTETGNLAFCRL